MNTESNVVAEALDAQRIAPAALSLTRPMYWSVRRELWENRSIYLAPLVVAAVFLLGFLVSMFHLPARLRAALALNAVQQQTIEGPYDLAAFLLMGGAFLVAIFYCLDALLAERRDRSILFWKSLPVSDLATVLSKASIPIIILPLLTFAITVVTHFLMLLLESAVLVGSGLSLATLWNHLPLFQMWMLLLYHLVAFHGFWYAPFYGWMLLASAWARRAAFLWAVIPPFAIVVVEKIAFNTSHFAALLQNRFMGGSASVTSKSGSMAMDQLMPLTPAQLLSSPGLWTGLIVAALFLAAAVQLRRYRDPI